MPRVLPAITLTVALAVAAGGCAGSETENSVTGDTLTVYAAMPLAGPRAAEAESVVDGIKLALADAKGQASRLYKVNAVFLSDAAGHPAKWDQVITANNARKVAQDSRAVAFIGDLDSGATRNSLPIVNEAGTVQVSPASGAVGLTRSASGTVKGEPERYYPTGKRTFVRLVPADDGLARAAARWAKSLGSGGIATATDGSEYGDVLGRAFGSAARAAGVKEAGVETARTVFWAGSASPTAAKLLKAGRTVIGTDALADPSFLRAVGGAADHLRVVGPALPATKLGPGGRRFAARFRKAFGLPPQALAVNGYESMALLLDAIHRAGKSGNDRQAIRRAIFATRARHSLLGTYSVLGDGETTLHRAAGYTVRAGRLVFDRELDTRR